MLSSMREENYIIIERFLQVIIFYFLIVING